MLYACLPLVSFAQMTSASPAAPWHAPAVAMPADKPAYSIDPHHAYSLGELIALAEEHNPDTRAAWERARAAAATLGISRSAMLPVLTAFVFAESVQNGVLFEDGFHIQDLGLYEPGLQLTYTIFDFGERRSRIDVSRARLLSANFAFNDVHRNILFGVMQSYYRLLELQGRRAAAEVSLANARAVEQAANDRLQNGLATLPDALEARSAAAQADYDLQDEIGREEVARGNLATLLALPPSTRIEVQPIDNLPIPPDVQESIDTLTERALQQRPDLIEKVEAIRGAESEVRGARSAYFPTFSFTGSTAYLRAWGATDAQPGGYAGGKVWDAKLSLNWTIFDGLRREKDLARARAEQRTAESEARATQDQVENEVWAAYSEAKTAFRRRTAAVELLKAADESYAAAIEAYKAGVRTALDVVAAQKTLAQARSADVSARAALLTSLANIAFRTGDLARTAQPGRQP